MLLFKDSEDRVRSILAPSVTYNEFRGVTGTFRYFTYPSALERLEAIAGYSQTIERELDLRYRNLGLFAGRFHADVRLLFESDSTFRFFGLGPTSRKEDETNMTFDVTGFYASVGVNITPVARLSLGETVQNFGTRRGSVPTLPFTGDVFPDLPGVDGGFVHAQRLALTYDDRDSLITPKRGRRVTLYAEASARLLGSSNDYLKGGIEAVYLRPVWDDRVVLVLRGLLEAIDGDGRTPFQVRPAIGGENTLRGFPENRFYGDARFVANAEARVRVLRLRLFGVTAEFEVAPFVDVGKVFNALGNISDKRLEVTPGVAFRGIAAPSVVGHIEIGVSREGPAIFVGLDYPF